MRVLLPPYSLVITGVVLLASVSAGVAAASTRNDALACVDDATRLLQQIAMDPQGGIPEEVTDAVKCLAVVLHLRKRRFGSNALRGRGIVSCRNLDAWGPPAFFVLSDGYSLTPSGVKDKSFIIMVMDQQSRQLLSSKKIEIGTDVSGIGGPIGRHVSPQNYYRLNRQMLTYSISKGHLASVSLDGATIREDRSSLEAIYSRGAGTEAVLSGRLPVPATARSFVAAVSEIVQSPRVSD